MRSLKSSVKGTLFVQDEDGEYKELGHVSSIEFSKELNEDDNNIFEDLTKETTFECEVSIKRYKKKRFKKLLMSYGYSRNLAETYSKTLLRNQITLVMLGGIHENARRESIRNSKF